MLPLNYSVRSVVARRATTLLTGGGVACVVFVLCAALMLQSGIRETLGSTGSSKNAIVLRRGSASEMASVLSLDSADIIRTAPGLARGPDGSPLAIGELVLIKYAQTANGSGGGNIQIRGIPANAQAFRSDVRVIEGRAARPGSDEAMVGRALRGSFKNLNIGQSFELRTNRNVRVVGVFEAGGSSHESELWVDLDTARSSFGREGVISTIRAQLESPTAIDTVRANLERDVRLNVEVMREDVFFEKQSEGTAMFVGTMGVMVALFASIGAMIGASSTMYAAINQRRRETGVLRALGFPARAILSCFLLESFLIAFGGGVLGGLASLLMVFVKFSMLNVTSFSQVVFHFQPTPAILLASIIAGSAMGLLGGFVPALRAARISPVEAMRA
jgi:putative ABC transport system permease protein